MVGIVEHINIKEMQQNIFKISHDDKHCFDKMVYNL